MFSILNCFKTLKLRLRKQPQQQKQGSKRTWNDARSTAEESIQISSQVSQTPPNDEVVEEDVRSGEEQLERTGLTATTYTTEPESQPEPIEEHIIEISQASTAAGELLQEDDRVGRTLVTTRSDTNVVPTIAVQRHATLDVVDSRPTIERSSSHRSLTPTLSRDNSQSSLRSRADSKGSSTHGHWLKEQLEKAELECPKHHHDSLIPRSALKELITVPYVVADIQARNPCINDVEALQYAEQVCQCASRLYATLAYIKKGAEIKGLLDERVTDEDLPFIRKANGKSKFALVRKNGSAIKSLDSWTDKHLRKFDQHQWWVSAPVFKLNEDLFQLDDKTILPFVVFDTREGMEKKQGGYSEVYPVRIHPAHHDFWESSGCLEHEPLVAVKRLFSDDENEFQKEKDILTAMTMKNHPHLIKLLATYKHDGKYHLMFPFANANLRKYWEDRPNPAFDRTTVLWSMQQMTGIANGLLRIHSFTVTRPLSIKGPGNVRVQKDAKLSVQKGEEWFGRHGDIKPENVLWFADDRETNNPGGILQIADFGLGRFHGRDSRSHVNPESVFSSPTYEPPECQLRLPVSRAYDMWSLGCLYLEFITWLLKGSAEIDGFSDFRGREATGTGIDDDNFFTIINDTEGPRATVREQVVTWTNELHANEKCSDLLHDLLDLIMEGLLVVESSSRYRASWLRFQLDEHLSKAQKDDDYLLKPTPRIIRRGVQERANSTPVATTSPRRHENAKPKRNSVVTFADLKASIKQSGNTTSPLDLVGRNLGTPSHIMTWPTHGPQIRDMPHFAR